MAAYQHEVIQLEISIQHLKLYGLVLVKNKEKGTFSSHYGNSEQVFIQAVQPNIWYKAAPWQIALYNMNPPPSSFPLQMGEYVKHSLETTYGIRSRLLVNSFGPHSIVGVTDIYYTDQYNNCTLMVHCAPQDLLSHDGRSTVSEILSPLTSHQTNRVSLDTSFHRLSLNSNSVGETT